MPLRLLAIDTTEEHCSAALLVDGAVASRCERAPRRHTELILPMMDGLLAEAGLGLGQLDALAFARGPGAFTGLRIASSVIQGAALGADLPVVPVSSLQVLAQGAQRRHAADRVLSALDARMGEVYWGAFARDAAGLMRGVIDETVCVPSEVPLPDTGTWVGAGSGWSSYVADLLRRCDVRPPLHAAAFCEAHDVAWLAAVLLEEGAAVPAEQALPTYLRDQVAWAQP